MLELKDEGDGIDEKLRHVDVEGLAENKVEDNLL